MGGIELLSPKIRPPSCIVYMAEHPYNDTPFGSSRLPALSTLPMGSAGGFQVFILFSNSSVYALCPMVPFGRYSFEP